MALSNHLPESSLGFWGNHFVGQTVNVISAISSITSGPQSLQGKLVRIDKFQYRYYIVLVQSGKEVNINIDHIFAIELIEEEN